MPWIPKWKQKYRYLQDDIESLEERLEKRIEALECMTVKLYMLLSENPKKGR